MGNCHGHSIGASGADLQATCKVERRIAALQTLATVLSLWEHNRLSCAFPPCAVGPGRSSQEHAARHHQLERFSRSPSNETRPIRKASSTWRTATFWRSSRASRTPLPAGPRSPTTPAATCASTPPLPASSTAGWNASWHRLPIRRCASGCWWPSMARAPSAGSRTCCWRSRPSASAGSPTGLICCTFTSRPGSSTCRSRWPTRHPGAR